MVVDVPASQLVGTFLEILLYGIYLTVSPQAMLVLRKKRLNGGLMIYLYTTMFTSFLLITFHLVVDLIRAFVAFTTNTEIPNAASAYYANVDTVLNLLKNSTLVCTTLVADALLLYRTHVVWGCKWWITILPSSLYCLDIAMSVWFTWSITEAKTGNSVLLSSALLRSKYFFSVTLAVNLVCTCLIAFRIRTFQRAVAGQVGRRRTQNALSIVLESAAIYTLTLVFLIATSCADLAIVFFFINSMPPLIGSVFTFIILRSSSDSKRYESELTTTSIAFRNTLRWSANDDERACVRSLGVGSEGVRIHLETIVHKDDGEGA